MKIKKSGLILLSVMMAFALCVFAACNGGGEESTYTPGDEVGSYYCVVDGREANLTIAEDGKVTLKLGDEELSGACALSDAKKIIAVFGESVDMVADVSYANGVITFLFRTKEYRFLRDVNYTVKFDSMGGSQIADKVVRNGKTVSKPKDPVLASKSFIGWYKDKEFKEPYQFGSEAVTKDITLYACYGAVSETEFTVTYNPNYEGATVTTAKTTGGKADLTAPVREGYEFVGWYISDYDDANRLTRSYNGEVLYQNTVLFAVWKSDNALIVSVTDGKISWNNLGIGSYGVYVSKDSETGEVVETKEVSAANEWAFDFSALEAGDYVVKVTYRGKSGIAYYRNKALAKVSLFNVVNGTALTYNAVPGAEEYFITVDCGNKAHKHTEVSNGASLTYNFANCEMQKGGIKFTVKATRKGYLPSVSETFVFEQGLEAVKELKVVPEEDKATWKAVEKATSYKVEVTYAETTETYYVSVTEFSLKNYGAGEITLKVTPVADNYYSPDAAMLSYTKETIASPARIRLSEKTLLWDEVAGATGYTVLIGGKTYDTKTNSLLLSESYFAGTDWTVAVKAATASASSLYSDPVSISSVSKLTQDMVYYKDGKVYWGNVFGAKHYRVEVDNKIEILLASDPHEYAIGITAAGDHTVKVIPIGENTGDLGKVTINLQFYEIAFNSNDGKEISSIYVADGDYLKLPDSVKGGYDFIGWYNSVDGAVSGKKYKEGEFTLKSNVTVYAGWDPKTFKVTMSWADGEENKTMEGVVAYMTDFSLPVPEYGEKTIAFYGWYLGSIRYTDENGNSIIPYNRISETSLEARFVEILQFKLNKTLQEGETELSYYVEKGEYINLVKEVTIPETYKGRRVTVINGSAFASASKLVKINIPDTIKYIFIGLDGVNATGSAFQSCSSLAEFNIYETESLAGEKGPYWTKDGIMYQNNATIGKAEMYAAPYAKTGEVTIADGIETIPQGIFASSKISSVVIPSSVTTIEKDAFKFNSNLTSIVFEDVQEGEEGATLSVADEAFYSVSNLLEITFPARMTEFNNSMFRSCSKLANVYFAGVNGKYISKDGVVMQKNEENNNLTLVYYPTGKEGEYEIPSDVTVIAESAFSAKFKKDDYTDEKPSYTFVGSKVSKVTIPVGVNTIGDYAFRSCTQITAVEFAGGINPLKIGKEAFYGLTNSAFTTLTLPENLTTLGKNAFGGCTRLVTVNLNAENCAGFALEAFGSTAAVPAYYVKTLNIGKKTSAVEIAGVFGNKVAEVNVDSENPNYQVKENVVYDYDITTIFFYPVEKAGPYVTPDTLTAIGANVFNGRKNLTKVTIKQGVTSIGTGAFTNCSSLTEVEFELRNTDLVFGDDVFKNCSALTVIELPEKTTEVGSGLFSGCNRLEKVTLPTTLVTIKKGYDTLLKKDIFNMFTGSKVYMLNEIIVKEGNEKYMSVNGVLYESDGTNPVTLLFCPSAKTGTIDVPKTVTKIGEKAFFNANASKLTFSEGIVEGASLEFGDQAFGSSLLEVIELPEGLTSIPDKMFYLCETLVTVTIPSSVTSIGNEAFYSCKALESITIPKNVTYIGFKAFNACPKLATVTFEQESEKNEDGTYKNPLVIADGESSGGSGGTYYSGTFSGTRITELIFPDRTTHVGAYMMGYSTSYGSTTKNTTLKKVVIPSTVEYIGQNAFYYCGALETVEFKGDGVSKLRSGTFKQKVGSSSTQRTYYYGLYNTFAGCSSLKTVINLPETSVEGGYDMTSTFTYSALTSVEIPATVSSMSSAFSYSPELSSVTFREGSILKTLKQSFSKCNKLTSIALPDGLETIGSYALGGTNVSYATSITSIVIPKTVQTIEYGAFWNIPSLKSVTFATYEDGENAGKCDLQKIQWKAFANTGITEFTFPASTAMSIELGKGTTVETNKGRLFFGCTDLTEVTLSKSVTDIEYVLKDAPSLKTINIAPDNTSFVTATGKPYIYSYDSTKPNNVGTAIVYVFGKLDVDADGVFKLDDGITEIAAYAFEGQNSIKSVTIPYTVQKIGTGAFMKCSNLTKVVFESSVEKPNQLNSEYLGESVFTDCSNLTSVTLPNGTNNKEISKYMFKNTGLTSVSIPASIEIIRDEAFMGCKKLTSVSFADEGNLKTIGSKAFNSSDISKLSLPKSLVTIGNYAFLGNANLSEIKFAEGSALETIGNNSFGYTSTNYGEYLSALKSIVIPKSVTTIGTCAFANCTALSSVTFEEGSALTTIGVSAFENTPITKISVPDSVTTIDNYAFRGCKNLTEVSFSKESANLKKIGQQIIEDTAVTSIELPLSLKKLDNRAFMNSTALQTVTLPDALTEIGGYVFYNCPNLVSIDIPDTVTKFGTYCFTGCIKLESVNFGKNSALTTLGTYMFTDFAGSSTYPQAEACISLKTFAVPDKVKALGNYMFRNCTALETVTFGDASVLNFLGTYTFRDSGLKSITVPKGVKMLGTSATVAAVAGSAYTFEGCKNLTNVEFLGDITAISGYVFYNCTSLNIDLPAKATTIGKFSFANTAIESVTIPKTLTNVKNLGDGAFAYCKNLTEIKVAAGNNSFTVDATTGALVNKSKVLVCVPAGKVIEGGAVTVPDGVTIGAYAFAGCKTITSITLPENTTSIPDYAFAGATGLKTFTVPAGVTKLGTGTTTGNIFEDCTSLTSVIFKGEITTLNGNLFKGCTALETFVIPASVTDLGAGLFNGSGIKEIVIPETVTSIYSSTTASNSVFGGSAIEKATLNSVATTANMFLDCENLTTVIIGENVTELKASMFKGCSALETIVIPDTVTVVGASLFQDCTALKNVTIGKGVTELSASMFKGCTALETIVIPDTVTEVNNYLFQDCTALKNVTIGAGLTALGSYTFQGCTALTEFTVPETVETFGTATFRDCVNLKTFTLNGQTVLGANMFAGCTALEKLNNTETLVEIQYSAFNGCTALKELYIPNVEKFGYLIFPNCTSLTKLVIEKVPTDFGRDNFNYWTENQTICFRFDQDETIGFNSDWYRYCDAKVIWNYTGE